MSSGFIKVKGRLLVDEKGEEYLMKGIAFGSEVWSNISMPTKTHHTEESYKVVSELGFNNIRFYLNYGIFEDDAKPYEYKQTGWDWLDWNISMAGKYGIKLTLNMHYPQGGFQSNGNGMELWTEKSNQDRLVALWKEIASRYVNEPVIMGFDLVNEPVIAKCGTDVESFAQWPALAQRITDAIRLVDKNHIILVERVNALKDTKTGISDWSGNLNGDMNLFLINDDNCIYEYHIYDPFAFTHQNAGWVQGRIGKFCSYPEADPAIRGNEIWGKENLQKSFDRFLKFSVKNNIPLYLGEFGVICHGFEEDRGGDRWVADMLDLCRENKVNFNYHTFHETAFGLYATPPTQLPGKLNQALYNVFKEKLTK